MGKKITIDFTPLQAEKIKACIIFIERYILPSYDPERHDPDILQMHDFYKKLLTKFIIE